MSFAVTPAATATPQPAAIPTPAPGATAEPSTIYVSPGNPAVANGPFGDSSANDSTPALRALPVETTDAGGPDASAHRKFYTLSASIREIYDDNINTSNANKQSSLETNFSPSVLVNFPSSASDLTGRYTFGLTYYGDAFGSDNNNGNNANPGYNSRLGSYQMTHDLVAQYSHSFSSRFQLTAAEEFRYDIEPNILQSVGTNYQNGEYYTNVLNGTFSAQWTPKFSTTLTYGNTIVKYVDSVVGNQQNDVENNGSFAVNYAVLPKISASTGVQVDNLTYESADRGYTSYTLFGGGSWQALPSLGMTGRGGASYTETVGANKGQISPYAALSVSWTLGARSSLNFNYSHEVTPSSQIGANGQISDRVSGTFGYQITSRLSSHLDLAFTSSTVTSDLNTSAGGVSNGYKEKVYEVDAGVAYSYNKYFSFDCGLTLSGVQSDNDNNNYTRDEAYVGVRGTY